MMALATGHDINNTQAIFFDDITKQNIILLFNNSREGGALNVLFDGREHGL